MKTEKEIRDKISQTIERNKHVLDCGPATTHTNSIKAAIQLSALVTLDALYYVLDEERPRFAVDDMSKKDQ